MQETTNLKLKKPEYTDGADILVLNENMDKLDEQVGGGLVKKMGDTMMGELVAGGTQVLTDKQVRNITISTAAASGGNNGDLWFKYPA